MVRLRAATWIAPDDEADRGNLLGAAVVACQRSDRDFGEIVVGRGQATEAIAAGRRTGMLILPAVEQVMPMAEHPGRLLQRAQDEGWRLLLLDLGIDSAAASGRRLARFLPRAAADEPQNAGPTPPPALRRRVSGSGEQSYRRSGLMHVECYEAALARAGVDLARVKTLLEWGAGPGRMTTYLPARAPHAQITAVDTDEEAIAWVADNLPVRRATAIAVLPPTPFEDDTFELAVGHSVFSHLGVEGQDRWLAELARITCPGGHVAVSFNGPAALTWHLEHPLVDVPKSIEQVVETDGIAIWRDDGWEKEFYDGYHTTFHQHTYVREHWAEWFDVISISEQAAVPIQDIVVLRVPPPSAAS